MKVVLIIIFLWTSVLCGDHDNNKNLYTEVILPKSNQNPAQQKTYYIMDHPNHPKNSDTTDDNAHDNDDTDPIDDHNYLHGAYGHAQSAPVSTNTDHIAHGPLSVREKIVDKLIENYLKSLQAIENPNYDPSIYSTFIPQQAVQQYVSQYGGPYFPPAPSFGYSPEYGPPPPQWFLHQPPPPLPPPFPHPLDHDNHGDDDNPAAHGELIVPIFHSPVSDKINKIHLLRELFPLPRALLAMFNRTGTFMLTLLGVVAIGGAITSALCAFTPFCSITFAALPFMSLRRNVIVQNEKENELDGVESVNRAEKILTEAIEKYEPKQAENRVEKIEEIKLVPEKNN